MSDVIDNEYKVKVYTHFNPAPVIMEHHEDEGIVEKDGYIGTQELVNMFTDAGERTRESRMYLFDADGEIPDDYPGDYPLDQLDAILAARNHKQRVKTTLERLQAEKAIKDAEMAVKASTVPSGGDNG